MEYERSITINIYEDLPYYKKKDLIPEETEYRLKNGYKLTYQQDIFGEKAYFLIKSNSNETAEHFFLVNNIADFLRKYLKERNVKVYCGARPDIVFRYKNKKIAVEVETGFIESVMEKLNYEQ